MTEKLFLNYVQAPITCDIKKISFLKDVIEVFVSIGTLFKERSKRYLAKTEDQQIVIWEPIEQKTGYHAI